jgi:hypothetical protein
MRFARLIGVLERALLGAAMGAALFLVEQRLSRVQRRRTRTAARPQKAGGAAPR